jgi:hypothetical protein
MYCKIEVEVAEVSSALNILAERQKEGDRIGEKLEEETYVGSARFFFMPEPTRGRFGQFFFNYQQHNHRRQYQ